MEAARSERVSAGRRGDRDGNTTHSARTRGRCAVRQEYAPYLARVRWPGHGLACLAIHNGSGIILARNFLAAYGG
jgi:hypothetical protein